MPANNKLPVVVFPYADLFRFGSPEVEIQSVTSKLAVSGDYDSFQQLMNTLEFVADKGITYGGQLLGVLFFWVPRSIWLDKPLTSGEVVAEHGGYLFTNIASPLWAEAYINAGLLGVVVGLFAYGALTSVLQRAYLERGLPYYSALNVLVPLLAAYQVFLVRGTLMSSFTYLVPLVGYLALAVVWRSSTSKSDPLTIGRNRVVNRTMRKRRR